MRVLAAIPIPSEQNLFPRVMSAGRWCVLVAVCYAAGNLAGWAGIPAAHLLGALAVGVAATLSGAVRRQLPARANRAAQAVVGVLMGSYLDPASVRAVAGSIVPLSLVTLLTMLVCVGVATVLPRLTRLHRTDAVLGMVPGGSAAIVACADELDADGRVVAFMQYLRVALVAASAPLVVLALGAAPGGAAGSASEPLLPQSLRPVDSARPVAGLVVLAALCVLGVLAGRRLGMPAPALLGPMVVTAVGVFSGAAQGFQPAGPLQDVVFAVVGLEVGLRFTPAALAHMGRMLPQVLAATVAVCAVCAGLAGALATALGIRFTDAYLATTPGGINAVLATAAAMHSQVALVSTTQSLRLFLVVLLAPPLIRWVARRESGAPRVRGARPVPEPVPQGAASR